LCFASHRAGLRIGCSALARFSRLARVERHRPSTQFVRAVVAAQAFSPAARSPAQATTIAALRGFSSSAIVPSGGSAIGLPSNDSFKRTPVHRLRFPKLCGAGAA
jgi:hypothetical protein